MKTNLQNSKKSEKIKKAIINLPYFLVDNLLVIENNKNYIKVLLSRLSKKEEIVSLKKGVYVSKKYLDDIEKKHDINNYLEFLANILYPPSYLSLEYVLSEHNILSESSYNFILITKNKTKKFSNKMGLFDYHHIKDDLFTGFRTIKINNFLIYKASVAKALFDFLYLRKNILLNKETVKELRLNLDNFQKKDISELKKYINIEGSKKMEKIFNILWKTQ